MDPLAYVIGQEEAELKLLVTALSQEMDILKAGHADPLENAVANKTRHIEALARLGRQRNQLLNATRLPDDREGLAQWARGSGHEALIQNFLALADEARELNRLNGQLIALRLNSTQAALAALTPHRADEQGLYGPKGQTRYTTGYRLIDTV